MVDGRGRGRGLLGNPTFIEVDGMVKHLELAKMGCGRVIDLCTVEELFDQFVERAERYEPPGKMDSRRADVLRTFVKLGMKADDILCRSFEEY